MHPPILVKCMTDTGDKFYFSGRARKIAFGLDNMDHVISCKQA